jgi:hypothetical protein
VLERPSLLDDHAFVQRMIDVARAAGVMRAPRFDRDACQLIEGDLRLDLLNVWHLSWQLERPRADEVARAWISPADLESACMFGRVDVVERAIAHGLRLGGSDPIAAAVGAWVVTPLHVRCAELLFAAGASATLAQLDAHAAESVGREHDRAMFALILRQARTSSDPRVRARVERFDGLG